MARQNLKQKMSKWFNGRELMKTEMMFKRIFTMWRVLMMVMLFAASTAHAAITSFNATVNRDGSESYDATDVAGKDSSPTNGIVRVNDTTEYQFGYVSDSTKLTTFVFTLPAGSSWSSISTSICNGGVTNTGTVMTCRRTVTTGAESFTVTFGAGPLLQNGATITPTVSIDGAAPVNLPAVTISAAPKATTRTFNNNLLKTTVNSVGGYSYVMNFGLGVDGTSIVNSNNRGAEALRAGTSFKLSMMPGAYLTSCPGGFTCVQSAPGDPVTITYNSTVTFSTSNQYGFFSPSQVSTIFTSFPIFVPTDPNNTPSNPADDNFPLGATSYAVNQITEFDPVSISNQSNFGADYAPDSQPGYTCPTGVGISQSRVCVSLGINRTEISPIVTAFFSNTSEPGDITNVMFADDNNLNNANGAYSEVVLPGMAFDAWSGFYSDQTGNGDTTDSSGCTTFNNTYLNLKSLAKVRYGATTSQSTGAPNQVLSSPDVVIEYSSVAYADDAARRAASCGLAGDGASGWVTDPSSLSGGYDAVTSVRYRYTKPLSPGYGLSLQIPFVRPTTTASLSLANGTVLPWFYQYSYVDSTTATTKEFKSDYTGVTGLTTKGGRVTTQSVMVQNIAAVQHPANSGTSVSPGATETVTITPQVIGSPIAGLDGVATNYQIRVTNETNCLLPNLASLPANAVVINGNYGADGIPCTSDDVSVGNITFNLGDVSVPGGAATTGYPGKLTSLSPIVFQYNVLSKTVPGNKTIDIDSISTSDLRTRLERFGGEDRRSTVFTNVAGVASFTASKTTTGVTNGKVGPNETFGYTINFGNGGGSDSGVGTFVDVLPFDGDDNGTQNLGAGKLKVVGLSSGMTTSAMGTVKIEYTTQASADVLAKVSVSGQEDGSVGIAWTEYTSGTLPDGITAVRFTTSNPLLIGYAGYGAISVQAPTINSTSTIINSIYGRTTLLANNPTSVQVVRSGSPVTIQGLDAATLRGRVFIDTNANGTYE
ncbi:hypothetical protein, partial [Hydromonas duriensis]